MLSVLQRWFPLAEDKNIGLYYVYNALHGLYPANAIVGLFFLSRGLTFSEIGIVFTVFSITGFLFEIPTGYIADRFGRRTSVIVGLIVLALAAFLWTGAETYVHFALLAAVWMIGVTCISGSFDAYLYDYLGAKSQLETYDAVLSKKSMLWYYAGAAGAVLGGYLFSIDPTYPYLLLSALFALAALVVLGMDHDVPHHAEQTERPTHVWSGFIHILSSRSLLWVTVFVSCFWGYHEFFISSVNSPYVMSLGVFTAAYLGVFMAAASLVKGYVVSQYAQVRSSVSNTTLLTVLACIQVVSLLGMGLLGGVLGLVSVFIFMQLSSFEGTVVNSFSQKYIPSASRATTLSTMNVVSSIAASGIGYSVGLLIDSVGLQASFFWVALGMAGVLGCLLFLKHAYRISI